MTTKAKEQDDSIQSDALHVGDHPITGDPVAAMSADDGGFEMVLEEPEDSKSYEVTKPVNLALLDFEIEEAVKASVGLMLVVPNPDEPPSKDNVATLYVSPAKTNGVKVKACIDAHEDREIERVYGDASTTSIVTRLLNGEQLELAEVTAVLRYLLSR